MKAPPNTTKVLKTEAERLTNRIFLHRYCVVQYKKTGKTKYWKVEKHHLIKTGQSIRFKFNIWNIIPISEDSHRTDKGMAAHCYGSNTEAEDRFLHWVKENLPLHWAWYLKHRYDKARTIRPSEWAEICDELRYYANHPFEAEQLIYEK